MAEARNRLQRSASARREVAELQVAVAASSSQLIALLTLGLPTKRRTRRFCSIVPISVAPSQRSRSEPMKLHRRLLQYKLLSKRA